jgi:Flp pilus assembly protein TadD, contains TPR repeats
MNTVKIWEEKIMIPTYEVGAADPNPMFLEKRVYQGSSGKVYPYPTTEKISKEKKDKEYNAVYLENKYLKVMILPELGGRIHRAYDKTNDYDFVYYNHVIKPALVGLIGPWISGGIEFNWPQHHRPTTFMPVDYKVSENADGSKTVFVHDVDQMYGTKGIAGFTLYPDKAYIEISGQLYNRTSLPQTFLWWANPAVAVNDYTQSIFPPDVHCVMDHGKRDVSRFPIATGVYYKHDYSEGVDISRYKNIPVPTSYMAEKSEYDFVGGYDYQKQAGILHVADHHISPGKKQWTWGCGEFGQAWDRNLTEEDGPYIELMTGVYTDNQPDFTWLKPFEEKTFKQYFMPYKAVGAVKNASIHAMLNLEVKDKEVYLCAYATQEYKRAKITLTYQGEVIQEDIVEISPTKIYEANIPVSVEKESDLKVWIEVDGKILVEYEPKETEIPEVAEPAKAAKQPSEIMTNEELFLTGQHIEQYRHATYLPDPYYKEGLQRDDGDSRINNAYGLLCMRRGDFINAEKHFRKAIERLTNMNPNPYNSEAYYNLGLVLFYQEKYDDAYDAFFKATWTNEQQEMSFYYLAAILVRKQDYELALELIEKALVKNSHNIKARGLKAVILRKLGRAKEAKQMVEENIAVDPFDFLSYFEGKLLGNKLDNLNQMMRNFHENYLMVARDYADSGCFEEAIQVLDECSAKKPMLFYYKGYYYSKLGEDEQAKVAYEKAEQCDPKYCFPNKLEDVAVLNSAIANNPNGAKAYYYLGNLYYDKLQFDKSVELWEASEKLDSEYPTLLRNLALAYYNKCGKAKQAREKLEKAFMMNTKDARIFLELDQLRKKMGMSFEERVQTYEDNSELIEERDDLYIEYVTILNCLKDTKRHMMQLCDISSVLGKVLKVKSPRSIKWHYLSWQKMLFWQGSMRKRKSY